VPLAIFWYLLIANAEAAEYCGLDDLITMVASTNQRLENMELSLQNVLKRLDDRFSAMEVRIEERMDEHVNLMKGRLDTIVGRLTTMEGKLVGFQGQLDGINDRLGAVEGRLTRLENKFAGLDDRFTAVEGDITTLTQDIATIKGTQIWLANAEIRRENSRVQHIPGSKYRPLHKTVCYFVQYWLPHHIFDRSTELHQMQNCLTFTTSIMDLIVRRGERLVTFTLTGRVL
jgi:predicted nuclease with TOPRIM domain